MVARARGAQIILSTSELHFHNTIHFIKFLSIILSIRSTWMSIIGKFRGNC